MLKSFKNLELLRYYLNSKHEQCSIETEKQKRIRTEQTMSTVFSSLLSAVVTVALSGLSAKMVLGWYIALVIGVYLIGFLVSYFLFSLVFRLITKIQQQTKIFKSDCSLSEAKKKIDEFDHIACDNVLIAYEFFKQYNTESHLARKMYYYCETLYYLKNALIRIRNVLSFSDLCINSSIKADAIDLYRVVNLLEMIKEIYNTFILGEQNNVKIDSKYKNSLIHNVNFVNNDIKYAEDKINSIK